LLIDGFGEYMCILPSQKSQRKERKVMMVWVVLEKMTLVEMVVGYS